jgi:NMD protein affecting ribosome stability and mRNA decay
MVNKATNKNLCSRCGAEIEEGYEYGKDEEPLCDECYFDNTEICPVCEGHFELDNEEEYFFITKES